MKNKLKDLIELFSVFCLIGLTNLGGGYSVLPFLQREIVQKRNWATDEEIFNYYTIGQCLPGLILINTATFIGYKKQRFWGGLFATAGMVVPGVLAAFLVIVLLFNFIHLPLVQNIIFGINVAVVMLIFKALSQFLKISIIDKYTLCIFIGTFLLAFKVSPVWIIFGAGLLGFLIKNIRGEIE